VTFARRPAGASDPLVPELVERALGYRPASVRHLRGGADHDAYEVDGTLIARVASAASPTGRDETEREVRLLQLLSGASPIAVPTVVAYDAPARLTIITKLAGTSLLDEPCPQPHRLAPQIAGLVDVLREIDRDRLVGIIDEDDDRPEMWLAEAAEIFPRVASVLTEPQRRLVERFVTSEPPSPGTELVLCHNDLGAEHLLAGPDQVTLTGVIDWSDAARTDPAVDLGRLYRDLGPSTVEDIVRRLGLDQDATLARAAFYACCVLLEDLEYGLTTRDRRYADAALSNLLRTFSGWRGR
jgi:aminoglycoside phosphotransferase (APT) family kinase protein